MPFIHIKSLPLENRKPISEILCCLNHDFAARTGVPLEHVHSTWEYFQPGHYAKGDSTPDHQPDMPHSILVDLLTPDFNLTDVAQRMMKVVAASLAEHTEIPLRKIFIHHRQVRSGMVFDDGEIAHW